MPDSNDGKSGLSYGLKSTTDLVNLSREAFCITDPPAEPSPKAHQYAFQRSARGSIMIDLGIHPDSARTGASGRKMGHYGADSVDPYSKLSVEGCVMMYLATVIGRGTLELSRAVAMCGYVLGVAMIFGFALAHYFACSRLLEIPQLVERNLETYSDIFGACFNELGKTFFSLACAMNYLGVCTIYVGSIIRNVTIVLKGDTLRCAAELSYVESGHWSMVTFIGVCLFFLTKLNAARDLQRSAKISLIAMALFLCLEVAAAFCRGTATTIRIFTSDFPFADAFEFCVRQFIERLRPKGWARLQTGASSMILAFADGGVLPYIVAGMLTPEASKEVSKKGIKRLTLIYVGVGVICYFGWGDNLLTNEDQSVIAVVKRLEGPFFWIASVMGLLFVTKAVTGFQLLFMPLLREIEQVLALETAPAVVAGLPWAISHVQFQKQALRAFLVFLVVLPYYLDAVKIELIKTFYVYVLLNIVQFLFPALLAVSSIVRNLSILADRTGKPILKSISNSMGAHYDKGLYIGGSPFVHLMACICYFCLAATFCFYWLWEGITRMSNVEALTTCAEGGDESGLSWTMQ
eukprot:TRINITY_DN76034_c0_g1_i1.p1 TRINITY_DN76034_c0_g1~~TRINITY_DN76034_c0_g1_i1.p1  ORF type:complete len:577 (+),score=58.52 TRINITY_DN76034_c0_g1_i1:82-1812(+)